MTAEGRIGQGLPPRLPPIWEVDRETKRPKNPQMAFDAIVFFAKHQEELKQNREIAKKFFETLESSDLTGLDVTASYQKLLSLREQIPELQKTEACWYRFQTSQGSLAVPKNLLALQSDLFKTQFQGTWVDQPSEGALDLNYKEADILAFAQFLRDGKTEISADNVLALLLLAEKSITASLRHKCLLFLASFVDSLENVGELYAFAKEHSLAAVTCLCLHLIKNLQPLPRVNDQNVSELVALAQKCRESHVDISISDNGHVHAGIANMTRATAAAALQFLQKFPIEDLQLRECEIETLHLGKLSSLISVAVSDCAKLTHASFPSSLKVDLEDLPNLASLTVPLATDVQLVRCDKLAEASFPSALKVDLRELLNLASLTAPLATDEAAIHFYACPKLQLRNERKGKASPS